MRLVFILFSVFRLPTADSVWICSICSQYATSWKTESKLLWMRFAQFSLHQIFDAKFTHTIRTNQTYSNFHRRFDMLKSLYRLPIEHFGTPVADDLIVFPILLHLLLCNRTIFQSQCVSFVCIIEIIIISGRGARRKRKWFRKPFSVINYLYLLADFLRIIGAECALTSENGNNNNNNLMDSKRNRKINHFTSANAVDIDCIFYSIQHEKDIRTQFGMARSYKLPKKDSQRDESQ